MALKYTYSSGKWNTWKLILSFIPSENEFTSILGRHSSNIEISLCHNILKPLTVWSDEILMVDMLCWLVLGMSMTSKTPMRLW